MARREAPHRPVPLSASLRSLAATPAAWAALAAMIATHVVAHRLSHRYFDNVVDDSLISMQYARNVAHGHGVVFNVGERVEGYTNFLWVMVMAGLQRACDVAGVPALRHFVDVSIGLAVLDVGLVYLVVRRLAGDRLAPVAAATALLVVDGGYQMWAAMALESHLLAACLLVAIATAAYRPRGWPFALGASLAAAQMTRPDAALFSAALVASLALDPFLALRSADAVERARARREVRELALGVATWLGLFLPYFAWRFSYYGHLHPNTYYLKVHGSKLDAYDRGLAYVRAFLEERAWWPALTALAAVHLRRPVERALVLYLATHVAYQVYVGGDFYAGHRFFIGQLPLFAVLAGVLVGDLERRAGPALARLLSLREPPPRLATSLGALLLLGALTREIDVIAAERGPVVEEIDRWGAERDVNRTFSYWLRRTMPVGSSIATGDIGSAGYFAGARVVDLFGVIDPVVAHRDVPSFGHGQAGHEKRATTAEVLARRPTFIKLGYLNEDFHAHGYFLDTSVPHTIDVDGIWRLDDLASSARVDEPSRLRFDDPDDRWAATGDAFERWPSRAAARGQARVRGQAGGFVNSYHPSLGDDATGSLVSPPFALVGDVMSLRVGGGRDPERLRVSLVVDGRRVFSETGRNRDVLGRKQWAIADLRGQQARIEIVDDATGPWGHVLVDEITQWHMASP